MERKDVSTPSNKPGAEGGLRSADERSAFEILCQRFESSPESTQTRLAQFAKYVRRQDLTRLLVRYEIFKRILEIKGSIIECGVFHGAGLITWANFSALLEPYNLTRRIYGFDTFDGFPAVGGKDASRVRPTAQGELRADCLDELQDLVRAYDLNRPLGHVPKVFLVKGDAAATIPRFVNDNPHLVVSLLFMDFDLYEPTRMALEHFLPRMPKGAVLAFDELDNPAWPGETLAAIEHVGLKSLRLERLPFDPYISFAVIG